jgi:hypothetical protein
MNRIDRYLIWLATGVAATAAVAWIAFGLQQERFAPAILFPLLVGGVLGAALVAIRRFTTVPATRAAVAAATIWGLLAVVGQDYIGHRRRVRAFEQEMAAQGPVGVLAADTVSGLRPRFGDHVAGLIRRQPVWWALDLLLTAGAAALTTAWGASRFPPAPS